MTRPAITHLGADVKIVGRLADGRAVVACVDRAGGVCGNSRPAWPHELRGLGWHMAEVKRLAAAAPLFGGSGIVPADALPTTTETVARPFLSAHYAALAQEREEERHVESHPSG